MDYRVKNLLLSNKFQYNGSVINGCYAICDWNAMW